MSRPSSLLAYLVRIALCLCLLTHPATLQVAAARPEGAVKSPPPLVMPPSPASMTAAQAPKIEGELLVRFREGVLEEAKGRAAAAKGARRKGRLSGESGLEKMGLAAGQEAVEAAEQWRSLPEVEYAEPNYLVSRDQAGPDDPRFPEQWALRNEGQAGGAAGSDINASGAWRETTGAHTTVVAVVDSGVDFTHPDLKDNRWANPSEVAGNGEDDDRNGLVDDTHGWDWVARSSVIRDEQGHGTAVAGLIAAEGDNGTGVTGVMWQAGLMSLRVLDSTGTGDVAAAVEAIDYAVQHGAQVINCSWGTDAESRFLRDAIERAGRRGVMVVASAGNSGRDIDSVPYYPAAYDLPNLISVAATDGFDNLAQFSNRGAARVTLAAPGTHLLTTRADGDYHLVTGTSAAVPLVTGIAGLIKTLRPTLGARQVRAAIVDGARPVEGLVGVVFAGGVADASGAVEALRGSPRGGGRNGQGGGPYVPPALRDDPGLRRGREKKGLVVEAPRTTEGAPGPGLPDLDASRRVRTSPEADASAPIHADLPCLDCDPSGGGGGGAASPSDPYFATARVRPANETGEPGVTPGSRNFNWSLPLVSLPGRANLDLSLALHYNSLVWTKQGASIQYNADHGTPGPGFQLGLPRLQARYVNSDTGAQAYVLITPSGGRVELKQVGATSVYEARDGSFTQLTFDGAVPVVRSADGTQYRFGTQAGAEWRCTQVKDRNGNYLSASYDATNGHLLSVTDTLGRVINLNYNADGNLSTITQARGSGASQVTHTYATFVYGTAPMNFSFSGLTAYGAMSGGSRGVLSSVTLSTSESYHFEYNSYGQVFRVSRKAPDANLLAQTTYTFNLTGAQTDCPRFTERRVWAAYWNGDMEGTPAAGEEAVTAYAETTGATWTDPEAQTQQTGTLVQQALPDGTMHKQYSHATGWDAGLPLLAEVWSGGVRRKWTSVRYTQDNTSLTYAQNPRVVEVNVYDGANRRRTAFEYTAQSAAFNLPSAVVEYAANATTVVRRTYTDYRWDAAYVDRRIIGLVDAVRVHDGPGALVSKVTYGYDWDFSGDMFQDVPGGVQVRQHDRAGYGPSFIAGRGNLSEVARWDAADPTNVNKITETKWRVNVTGSVLMERDQLWHQKFYEYGDSFSDGNNARNTFAYPTKFTDEDGYVSTAQYSFDLGGVALTRSPASGTGAGVTYAETQVQFDAHGRVERVTTPFSGAYRRWVYDPTGRHVHTYETIKSTAQADEFHSWRAFDGAGRVIASAADHPGSIGGYTGQYLIYDRMGRLADRSNPTEMDAAWAPKGDDPAWVYTHQDYDWQGRPTQTTNPDGSTRVLAYGGCGCAGGAVVTAHDEHGRSRRTTKDVLGRLAKVEELNWDDTVYATTTYTYNTRDQLTQISQQGQLRTFEYDGHGRLAKRTTPEQGATTYTYNSDDTVNVMTDARGATTAFGYSYRHLVTSLTYGVATGKTKTWADTANVTYGYDAAGNRTSMTDGQGAAAYHYDSLGRLDWEERNFTALAGTTDPPAYRLSYGYNVGGELTSLTYPSQLGSVKVTYGYDEAGRPSSVGGSGYGGVTGYASALQYRAFGALKAMSYSNGRSLTTDYDSRLRATKWDVAGVQGYEYEYGHFNEGTGRVTYAKSLTDATLDRSYEYDHLGRLAVSHSGTEARAHAFTGQWTAMDGPFSQGYEYDVWGNLTRRHGWGGDVQGGSPGSSTDLRYTYAGNRRAGNSHDAAGNVTAAGGQTFSYDAAGSQTSASSTGLQQHYDGDGIRVKKTESGIAPRLYLRSTVLGGQVIAEVAWNGSAWVWSRGYVYLGPQLLAVQQSGSPKFIHEDPVTKSKRVTDIGGAVVSAVESDPWGADTSRSSNAAFQPRRFTTYERDANGSDEAMFRRYSRAQARFEQADPYDGSYDLTDPQSFNRYSYTQNDPVNLTDPTGLMSVCFLGLEVRSAETGAPGMVYFGSNCVEVGDRWGGYSPPDRPGGGLPDPTPPTPEQNRLPFNSCEEFVNYLVDRAVEYAKQDSWSWTKARQLGMEMAVTAYSQYEAHIHNRFDGFKTELTEAGKGTEAGEQGAGVYGHIFFAGGSTLYSYADPAGHVAFMANMLKDRAQSLAGQPQGRSEIAGNFAGQAVGNHIWNFLSGKTPADPERLRNSLASEMCKE